MDLRREPLLRDVAVSGRRAVHARAAGPDERPRLWARWAEYDEGLDAYAARRSRETAVVILSPRADAATG